MTAITARHKTVARVEFDGLIVQGSGADCEHLRIVFTDGSCARIAAVPGTTGLSVQFTEHDRQPAQP